MKEHSVKKNWVFFVPESIPSFAGSGRNAFNFASYLNTKKLNASIVTLNRNLKLNTREITENVNITRIPYFAFNLFTKILSLIHIVPAYLYHIIKNNVIIIYSAHLIGYQLIIILAWLLDKKIVFRSSIYSADDISSLVNKKITGRINKLALGKITVYFSITPAFTKSFLAVYNNRSRIFEMPQGINEAYFNPPTIKQKVALRKQLGLNTSKKIILSVGYLIKRKGFEEIFNQLSKISDQYLYVVVGDYSPCTGHFVSEKEIQEMQYLYYTGKELLQNNVRFTGSKSNIHDYFRASDIFLHNASKEGLPNVILEAMACGLTVITRKLEGLSGYLLSHLKNAIVFENPVDIPLFLNNCINNPEICQRLSKNAYNTVLNSFTFKNISEKLIDKLFPSHENFS